MKTKREQLLEIALLKEKVEKLSGKKVVFKEEVIKQLDFLKIIEESPKNSIVTIEYSSPVKMNKTGKNDLGEKILNPFLDKNVVKHNIVTGKINFNYKEEKTAFEKEQGIKTSEETEVNKRTWGEKIKEGVSIVQNNGSYYLEILANDSAKPSYTVNNNSISKEELSPYMSSTPTNTVPRLAIRSIKLSSIDNLIVGNKEYSISIN